MSDDKTGMSGNTPSDLREVAAMWDKSALYCDDGYPDLAARDRRIAAAMRKAADILEAENVLIQWGSGGIQ